MDIMTSYGKVYLKAFGLDETDFIECACCQKKATEFHHIISRKRFPEGLNMIENILPICRICHIEYGEINYLIPMLLKIQERRLQIAGIEFDNRFFEFYINKYTAKATL